MKPLRNKDSDPETPAKAVPTEVKEYYQAEKQDRIGTAWMLSIATFVATVIVVLGLFFGGRWAYRSLNKDTASTKTNGISKNDNKPESTKQPVSPGSPTPSAPTTPPATKPQAPPPAPPASPAPTPLASSPAEMPHTGPDSLAE